MTAVATKLASLLIQQKELAKIDAPTDTILALLFIAECKIKGFIH